jgi:C4-dicarboxylate-specific signal transduction histidine kinase
LSRPRFYNAAPPAIMVVTLVFVLAMLNQYPNAHTACLALIPIFMSSLFYHARGILAVTCLSILLVISASTIFPGNWEAMPLTLIYLLGSTALTVVSNWMLRQSESNLQTRSEQLQDSQSRFRAAMDGSLSSFYILKRSYDNADWSVLEANRTAERQAGLPLPQLIARKLTPSMLPADCGDLLLRRCTDAMNRKETIADSVETPDDLWYEYVIVPFNDCVALTINDITQRKKSEKQDLDLALERERVELLQQIIGDASHDMMSPLSAVKMNVYLIRQAEDAEARAPRLAAVDQQITRLQEMIRDLALMSELEHLSASKLHLMKMDANTLLKEIGAAYDAVASVKEHQLVTCLHTAPLNIFIDRPRLEGAITNLIENALKYTPAGSTITVSVEPRGVGAAIEVRDNGKGINDDALPYLFERYYRAEEHRDPNSGVAGTGLGLTIVKKVVEAHQGHVEAHNAPEGGAVFRIWLPLVPELATIIAPANSSNSINAVSVKAE